MHLIKNITDSILQLVFPQVCNGCGSDLVSEGNKLCLLCHESLPQTSFHLHGNNPVEKLFWGRLPVTAATAQYYFSKGSLVQHLMHRFKYKGDRELGLFLGRLMGYQLKETNRFNGIDILIPLPLFPEKERRRGYNQATLLCEGIAEVWEKPIVKGAMIRTTFTESQTKKNRIERWQNMKGRFELTDAAAVKGKHILLVDDVVTTGATLEACGNEIMKGEDVRLSVATLCLSSN
jgi:ComF family protein